MPDNSKPRPLDAAADEAVRLRAEGARLLADWRAARAAGQRSKAAFVRARYADPRVATRMLGRLDAAIRAEATGTGAGPISGG